MATCAAGHGNLAPGDHVIATRAIPLVIERFPVCVSIERAERIELILQRESEGDRRCHAHKVPLSTRADNRRRGTAAGTLKQYAASVTAGVDKASPVPNVAAFAAQRLLV